MTPSAANPPLMEKIELIQSSLRAFCFGLPGIVPFLGTPFAIVALMHNSRIKRRGAALLRSCATLLVLGFSLRAHRHGIDHYFYSAPRPGRACFIAELIAPDPLRSLSFSDA